MILIKVHIFQPQDKSLLFLLSTPNGGTIGGVFGKRVIIGDIVCSRWGK